MYCVSEQQCFVPGHAAFIQLVSVSMIMRILTMTVIIFIACCTEQIVRVGNAWYILAPKVLESPQRYGIYCVTLLLFILNASSQRIGSRSVTAANLNCTSFVDHEV
jgi:hypothetical protein